MNALMILIYIGGYHGRVKLTPQEKAMLPYIWTAFILIIAVSVFVTYRSWKKTQR